MSNVGARWSRPGSMLLAVLLLLTGVLSLIQPSSASRIPLASPTRPMATSVARCSGNTLTITINVRAVTVTGLSASACAGKTLRVLVRSGSTTQTATGTVSGSSASLTLGSAVSTVAGVTATIATWRVPVTWSQVAVLPAFSCTIPAAPSVPCTVTVVKTDAWGETGNRVWQTSLLLSTTSTQPVAWRLTINLSDPSFPFLTRRLHDTTGGGLVNVVAAACSATPRTVTATGNVTWGYSQISASSSRDLQVRGDESGSGGNLLNC